MITGSPKGLQQCVIVPDFARILDCALGVTARSRWIAK